MCRCVCKPNEAVLAIQKAFQLNPFPLTSSTSSTSPAFSEAEFAVLRAYVLRRDIVEELREDDGLNGRTPNLLRRWRRLRADDGDLEPSGGRNLPRLAGAILRPTL